MPRDYAKRTTSRSSKSSKKAVPGPVWFAVGLVLGLFVAFLVYLQKSPDVPRPIAQARSSAPARAEPDAPPRRAEKPKPTPSGETPRFEFYTILPEMEVVVPDREVEPRAPDPATTTPDSEQPAATPVERAPQANYILQAGSFRRFEDADRRKAELALLGVVGVVQRVTINGNETWHRIRLGPYRDLRQLEQVRKRLLNNGISTLVMKAKG